MNFKDALFEEQSSNSQKFIEDKRLQLLRKTYLFIN